MRLLILLLLPLIAHGQLRIDHETFDPSEKEIREVLAATIAAFPETKLPPLFVTNSSEGPLTLFDRSPRGEVIIKLDVQGRYWSQMIYQFAHELTHIRAGFRLDGQENKWFEETLCETASLYTLRKLTLTWRDHPHFGDYRHKLADYAQKIITTREKVTLESLPAFYQKHKIALRKNPKNRPINGAIAAALLPLFEIGPERWNSLTTLNKTTAKKDLTFPAYFLKWYEDSTQENRATILLLKNHFLK
ncbi:hypothetical protein N9F50_00285 [Akkermansiaceae bacterium]|nr:hypothetical protein [Akkermansiaceae bacterium]